jgi:DNA-directed RNA polymerase specialized sigma24 family protein
VLRYQQQVYNVGYRIMGDEAAAADVTQEAFISLPTHRLVSPGLVQELAAAHREERLL